jgi:GNAT superfamily N-acetyltransferase
MKIIELKTDKEFESIYPLVRQLSPQLSKPEFKKRLKIMRKNRYRCIAAYEGNKMVGCSGFWEITRFWSTYIEPDNVVVDEKFRGKGVGVALMRWLEKEAKRLGFQMVKLDSYTSNHASHRFYGREGYIIYGFVFVKKESRPSGAARRAI